MEYSVYPYKTKFLQESKVIGHVDVSYERLTSLFGKPLAGDGKETDCEWNVQLENNHIISIYNYKNGKAYMGKDADSVQDIKTWTINGFYANDFEDIREFLEGKTTWELNVHMFGKDKDNIIKRLRTIADHMEEGMIETDKPSDYHSWSIKKIAVPATEEVVVDPPKPTTYRL